MDYAKESLKLHEQWRGKIQVAAKIKVENKEDLSLAYTPGVAQPCLEIQKDYDKSFSLTARGNTVAVVTDGTAVLGLGISDQRLVCRLWKEKHCFLKRLETLTQFLFA